MLSFLFYIIHLIAEWEFLVAYIDTVDKIMCKAWRN